MELVWVLWGVLTTLNALLLVGTLINLRKTQNLLKNVEKGINKEEALVVKNSSILDEMMQIVIGEKNE